MKNDLNCAKEFNEFRICDSFNEHGQCIFTTSVYESKESGSICKNPYYKTSNTFVCHNNKHGLTEENEMEEYIYDKKVGMHELKTLCLGKDEGNGVIFSKTRLGENVCKVLKQKPDGTPTHDPNAVSGSVCFPVGM